MNDSNHGAHRGTWKELRKSFDVAVERLPQALQTEGFGVSENLGDNGWAIQDSNLKPTD